MSHHLWCHYFKDKCCLSKFHYEFGCVCRSRLICGIRCWSWWGTLYKTIASIVIEINQKCYRWLNNYKRLVSKLLRHFVVRRWITTTNAIFSSTKSLRNCSAAFAHSESCLAENNFNPNPVDIVEFCRMTILELDCADSAFAANNTTCQNEQDAINASRRIRPTLETLCAAVGSGSTSVVTSFFAVIVMACVSLIQW